MQLIEQLRALGSECEDTIPCLNQGGCCVYAAHVAKRLQELGIPVWGIVADRDSKDKGININDVRLNCGPDNSPKGVLEWNAEGVEFYHVLLQFVHEGKIWTHDSGTTTDQRLTNDPTLGAPIIDGNLTVGELSALARDKRWNPSFDRPTGRPAIKASIATYLSDEALRGEA